MKTVTSEERTTGMGATRFTEVMLEGKWTRVSDMDDSRYEGRAGGVHSYAVDIADDAVVAEFYRSNSGKEEVFLDGGRRILGFV